MEAMAIIHEVSEEALNLIKRVEDLDARMKKTFGVIAGIFEKAEVK